MDGKSNDVSNNSSDDDVFEKNTKWIRENDRFHPKSPLHKLRKVSNLCTYTFKRGQKRGLRCLQKTGPENRCAKHKLVKEEVVKVSGKVKVQASLNMTRRIKFKRLKRNIKYLLFKIVDHNEPSVHLWCANGELIEVKLPKSLLPLPKEKHYFLEFNESVSNGVIACWKMIGL